MLCHFFIGVVQPRYECKWYMRRGWSADKEALKLVGEGIYKITLRE